MRLKDKVAVVVGAGQTPGDTIGNGRAAAILFAREGASVVLVDRDLASAVATREMIDQEGGRSIVIQADITREQECQAFVSAAVDAYGRIDILHNNVGIAKGDGPIEQVSGEAWDRIMTVNLKGMLLSCQCTLPVMRKQQNGSIINISSIAAVCAANIAAYKVSKAGVNALTHQIAIDNARFGIRANAIMPGLIETPMAIEGISQARGIPKDQLIRERNARVPLGRKMGTAWDVAYAALFLASDESRFITGVVLPVDGGQSARIG